MTAQKALRLQDVEGVAEVVANSWVVGELERVVARYGTPEEINRKAREQGSVAALKERLRRERSPYLADLAWLEDSVADGAFVEADRFAREQGGIPEGANSHPVTLELSALQYFPWLIAQAKAAIRNGELLPGRFIRVRNMAEQEADGDLAAVAAAMGILGCSWVETRDTRGTDGSNVHLGGPETITGYFGGVGQPNDHPLRWAGEFLHYYTGYGVREVLNVNPGTVLLGFLLYRMGVDIHFKVSVFMGNDNPFAVLSMLSLARLFARDDGTTPLSGFNVSNSMTAETIRRSAALREALGLTEQVRIEHHITETYRSIVRQPYNRRGDIVELGRTVPNLSAKHEGGDPETEAAAEVPSDLLHYFLAREDIEAENAMEGLETSYLRKHEAVNATAAALVRAGIPVAAAPHAHHGTGRNRVESEKQAASVLS
ncbi:MAG: hypothetical protein K9L28_01615 [Synergistales bacterium]|nr:hypothetical protein [Synergistales bacterium]